MNTKYRYLFLETVLAISEVGSLREPLSLNI